MDRNGTALNTLMFIRMSSNIFYPFSTIYPGSGYKVNLLQNSRLFFFGRGLPPVTSVGNLLLL